jgi:hypothetical protein
MTDNAETTLRIAKEFSRALDGDDFDKAAGFHDADCIYNMGSTELSGAEAIMASYRESSHRGRKNLEEVHYQSLIENCTDQQATILFIDRLKKGASQHEYRCKQQIFVSPAGKIYRIEQVEIEGQKARLDQFFESCGGSRVSARLDRPGAGLAKRLA